MQLSHCIYTGCNNLRRVYAFLVDSIQVPPVHIICSLVTYQLDVTPLNHSALQHQSVVYHCGFIYANVF